MNSFRQYTEKEKGFSSENPKTFEERHVDRLLEDLGREFGQRLYRDNTVPIPIRVVLKVDNIQEGIFTARIFVYGEHLLCKAENNISLEQMSRFTRGKRLREWIEAFSSDDGRKVVVDIYTKLWDKMIYDLAIAHLLSKKGGVILTPDYEHTFTGTKNRKAEVTNVRVKTPDRPAAKPDDAWDLPFDEFVKFSSGT